ncbi:hypothetical protein [Desulfocicer niacini]
MVNNALTVFISGIAGVFGGMALLYFSLKITSFITDRVMSSVGYAK